MKHNTETTVKGQTDSLTHDEKLLWMLKWCKDNKCELKLTGEVGFGRECVGIEHIEIYGNYVEYKSTIPDDIEKLDENLWWEDDIWTPEDAYHKHTCIAVLGRGEAAEAQLYEWLKWFQDNNFVVKVIPNGMGENTISRLLGETDLAMMVKKS